MLQLLAHVNISDEALRIWIDALHFDEDDRIFRLRQAGVKRAMMWVVKRR